MTRVGLIGQQEMCSKDLNPYSRGTTTKTPTFQGHDSESLFGGWVLNMCV